MTEHEIILARLNLTTVAHSLHQRFCTVKEKQPNRKDLLDDLAELRSMAISGHGAFLDIEKEWRASRQRNYDLEVQLLELNEKYRILAERHEELKKNINL